MESQLETVVEQKSSALRILEEIGIHEGDKISSDQIREMVIRHEQEIIEGVTRNCYGKIKRSFARRMQSIRDDIAFFRKKKSLVETDRQAVDLIFFLETRPDSSQGKFNQVGECKLVFTYEASTDRINEELTHGQLDNFTGLDILTLTKISYGKISLDDMDHLERFRLIPDIRTVDSDGALWASYENVRLFLERVLKPPEEFIDAEKCIDAIWAKYSFPEKDADNLKKAVFEFGNFEFFERDGFHMIGRCLTAPGEFEDLVRRRFGIVLKRCELTGANERRKSYSAEELSEIANEREGVSVHEASIYQDTVIIDWTSRQFQQDKPLPEITDLNEEPDLKKRIEITNS